MILEKSIFFWCSACPISPGILAKISPPVGECFEGIRSTDGENEIALSSAGKILRGGLGLPPAQLPYG